MPDDQRVVAAKLERQDLVRSFGELLVKRLTARAEPVNSRPSMPAAKQRLALVRPADQEPDRAFGNAASR
jgi:hypothetical protein